MTPAEFGAYERRKRRRLRGLAWRLARNAGAPDAAEDVAQDALLACWRASAKLDGVRDTDAWLWTVARAAAVESARAVKAERAPEAIEAEVGVASTPERLVAAREVFLRLDPLHAVALTCEVADGDAGALYRDARARRRLGVQSEAHARQAAKFAAQVMREEMHR